MRYFPFLKGKRAEFRALRDFGLSKESRIQPVFDIAPANSDPDQNIAETSLTRFYGYATQFVPPEIACVMDLFDFSPDWRMADGSHPLRNLAEWVTENRGFGTLGLGLDRDEDYYQEISKAAVRYPEVDFFFRWLPEDIEVPKLSVPEFQALVARLGIKDRINFHVLDHRTIFGGNPLALGALGANFVSHLPTSAQQLVITSSGIPHPLDFSKIVGRDSVLIAEFLEKQLHANIAANVAEAFEVNYGDYGAVNCEFSEPSMAPELLSTIMLPKIFYSSHSHWYFARGTIFNDHPEKRRQYFTMAAALVGSGYFYKRGFSYGDDYIADKADRIGRPGSAESWLRAEIAHHLSNITNAFGI